jgi:hypothetical protein
MCQSSLLLQRKAVLAATDKPARDVEHMAIGNLLLLDVSRSDSLGSFLGVHRVPSQMGHECLLLRTLSEGEFNRSTQHPSLERTDCWCRSNFSIKSQDIRHRSRSFERLRRFPPILAALPALSALCLQLRQEPCPCMSLHMHAIPTWRIRVKGCCVDRLSPPSNNGH